MDLRRNFKLNGLILTHVYRAVKNIVQNIRLYLSNLRHLCVFGVFSCGRSLVSFKTSRSTLIIICSTKDRMRFPCCYRFYIDYNSRHSLKSVGFIHCPNNLYSWKSRTVFSAYFTHFSRIQLIILFHAAVAKLTILTPIPCCDVSRDSFYALIRPMFW